MMFRRSFLRLIPLGALLGPRRGAGGEAEARSPEAAAKAAFRAMQQGPPEEFIRSIGPEGLRGFRSNLEPVIRAADRAGRAEQVAAHFGVPTRGDLKPLDDAAFFRAFWDGLLRSDPELREGIEGAELLTSGYVTEGLDRAHVLYRLAFESGWVVPILVPRVVTLRRHKGDWALELGGGWGEVAATAGPDAVPPRAIRAWAEVIGVADEEDGTARYAVYRARIDFANRARFRGTYAFRLGRGGEGWALAERREWRALATLIEREHGLVGMV